MPKASSKSRVSVLVTLDEDRIGKIKPVVDACRKAGLDVQQVMSEDGILRGAVDAPALKRLKAVKGVAHVEEEEHYQLAPPNSPVQ